MAKLAKPALFEGAPVFHIPSKIGFTASKPIIYRVPVTGKRPIKITVENLPEGLSFDGLIITGTVIGCGDCDITFRAENSEGKAEVTKVMSIGRDLRMISPLLGFTTWNAFDSHVTQEDYENSARLLVESGLADVGYAYVNLDSGWQYEERYPNGTVRPNPKFPDFKGMTDRTHALGLKCGIYETPMKLAWGCPREYDFIPGCTDGVPDPCFPDNEMGGIGTVRYEKENVENWDRWGFDYLKYDWYYTDTVNCELMRKELRKASRDFVMSVTVHAIPGAKFYWKKYINSYRCNHDSIDKFEIVKKIFDDAKGWEDAVVPGHFFDMDMLETGFAANNGEGECKLTEDEQIFALTMRYIFNSPIQISSRLEYLSDFELALYANFEALEINQDVTEAPKRDEYENGVTALSRHLEDGSLAIAVFNPTEEEKSFEMPLENGQTVRDVWANEELGFSGGIQIRLAPHSSVFYRIH